MPWAAIASGAAPIAGGLIGNAASAGDREQSNALLQQALANIQKINSPTVQQLQVALQKEQNVGDMTPTLENQISQQNSLMGNIQTDPRLVQAQMTSLAQLQNEANGGMRPEDIAAITQARNASEQQANSDRMSILQAMQQRGQGGSGADLAAQLNASQAAANRANASDLTTAGQASQRALQAIAQSGQFGSQMQAQQFSQGAQQAAAQDAINRYNAMNAQGIQANNVNAQNQSQVYNLNKNQQIANTNTGIANQQEYQNTVGAQQGAFGDQMAKTGMQTGATNTLSNNYGQQAANTQQMWAGIGNGVGKAASGVASMPSGTKSAGSTSSGTNYDFTGNNDMSGMA